MTCTNTTIEDRVFCLAYYYAASLERIAKELGMREIALFDSLLSNDPDASFLPEIALFFEVDIHWLRFGKEQPALERQTDKIQVDTDRYYTQCRTETQEEAEKLSKISSEERWQPSKAIPYPKELCGLEPITRFSQQQVKAVEDAASDAVLFVKKGNGSFVCRNLRRILDLCKISEL